MDGLEWSGGRFGSDRLCHRRAVPEHVARANSIVVLAPALDQDSRLGKRVQGLTVQQFVAQLAGQALHVPVLPRATRIDESAFTPTFLSYSRTTFAVKSLPLSAPGGPWRLSMKWTHHTTEEIINKTREADTTLSSGPSMAEALQHLGVSEQTFQCWRNKYGSTKSEEVRRLKDLDISTASRATPLV